jgi:hypothetical protein
VDCGVDTLAGSSHSGLGPSAHEDPGTSPPQTSRPLSRPLSTTDHAPLPSPPNITKPRYPLLSSQALTHLDLLLGLTPLLSPPPKDHPPSASVPLPTPILFTLHAHTLSHSFLFESPHLPLLHPSPNLLFALIRWPLSRNLRSSLPTLFNRNRREINLSILYLPNTTGNEFDRHHHSLPFQTAHRTARPPPPHTRSATTPTTPTTRVLRRQARRRGISVPQAASFPSQ